MGFSLQQFGKTAVHGIVFGAFTVMTVSGIAYALTYDWSDPSVLRGKTSWDVLQSSQWNLLVGNVDNLNERMASLTGIPTGTVIAFNGSSCPSGWTAAAGSNVPTGSGGSSTLDLRGEFVRGLDGGRWVDAWRALASAQAQDVQPHTHPYTAFGNSTLWQYVDSSGNAWVNNYSNNTGNNAGTETRPRNVALLYCVKN